MLKLKSEEKPREEILKEIEAQVNEKLGNRDSVELFKSNFKAKKQQFSIMFKTSGSAAGSDNSRNAISAKKESAVNPQQRSGIFSGWKPQLQSPAEKYSDEILCVVLEQLGIDSEKLQIPRNSLEKSVVQILERFQNQSYAAGFKARDPSVSSLPLRARLD